MNDEFEQTRKLVRLKRYEQPPEGYMDGFLSEFHQRQRAELMQQSSRSLFFERVGTYLSDFGGGRLMFAGGIAAAIALAVFVTNPGPNKAGLAKGQSDLTADMEAPSGTLSPVAEEVLSAELNTGQGSTAESGEEAERFRMTPRPDAETQTFEL